jgi:hypothetical protein
MKFNRKSYEWPSVTAIHPTLGSIQLEVHAVRAPESTDLVLVAFQRGSRRKQVDLIESMARKGYIVERLEQDVLANAGSRDVVLTLADELMAHPNANPLLLQVSHIGGAR